MCRAIARTAFVLFEGKPTHVGVESVHGLVEKDNTLGYVELFKCYQANSGL